MCFLFLSDRVPTHSPSTTDECSNRSTLTNEDADLLNINNEVVGLPFFLILGSFFGGSQTGSQLLFPQQMNAQTDPP